MPERVDQNVYPIIHTAITVHTGHASFITTERTHLFHYAHARAIPALSFTSLSVTGRETHVSLILNTQHHKSFTYCLVFIPC